MVKNEWAMILFAFRIRTDKQMMVNQLDIVANKVDKKAVMIEVAVSDDRNIRLRKGEKLEKYKELREQMERTWGGKTTVIPEVIGALGAALLKLEDWLQQIPETTYKISFQMRAVL